MTPFYADEQVTLHHGDMREILPSLDVQPDCIIADPKSCANCGKRGLTKVGYCGACYQRWLKAGRPGAGPPSKSDDLEGWRRIPEVASGRKPTDLDVGTAGEHLVCADLLLGGYVAFRADQNCAYDVAVDLGGRLIRLQVKSTRTVKPMPQRETEIMSYQWHVRRAGKGGRRKYEPDAFDLLALVALDIRIVAYLPPSRSSTVVQIRPLGTSVGKQFSDYPFGRALSAIEAVQ